MKINKNICYLCGLQLTGDNKEENRDHIPPKQFFSKEFRKKHQNLNFITLPVHKKCHKAYGEDEEYFKNSIGSTVPKTRTGKEIFDEIGQNILKRPQSKYLAKMVLNEFGKIQLCDGKRIKYFDEKRIWNVIWKIVRGLYFCQTDNFLPESTPKEHNLLSKVHKPPDRILPFILDVHKEEFQSNYSGFFDYKFKCHQINSNIGWMWNLYFWENIIFFTAFIIKKEAKNVE